MISGIKNFVEKNTGFIIRLDDIAENMHWDFMDKAEKLFDEFNIKINLVAGLNENIKITTRKDLKFFD